MLQFLKVALNKIAFFVQLMVVITHFLAVAAWRDDRLSSYVLDRYDKGVGVVPFISNNVVSRETCYQVIRFGVIRCLSFG